MFNSKEIFVVSAPSGTGKTTLNKALVERHPEVEIAVSHTTRAIRKGEKEGVDYYYINKKDFERKIESAEMLEFAEVFGNLYGTSLKEVKRILAAQHKAILEIDVQGWEKAGPKLPNATSIFILPPSINVLWKRLESRATDSTQSQQRRIHTAKQEIKQGRLYEHFIINDNLEQAFGQLQDIVIYGKSSGIGKVRGLELCSALLSEFEKTPWKEKLKELF